MKQFKNIHLIGHYNDGNTLLVQKGSEDEVIKNYHAQAQVLGKSLKLQNIIELEIQKIFK